MVAPLVAFLPKNRSDFDFAPVEFATTVREGHGPTTSVRCLLGSHFLTYELYKKNRVSKPRHAARLRQPSYDKFENIYGKKYFNCRPVFSEGVLCFELVVVENFLSSYQKGTT